MKAFNEFYIVEPFSEWCNGTDPEKEIFGFASEVDVHVWRQPTQLSCGKVVNSHTEAVADPPNYLCEPQYSNGDVIVFDPSRVITTFDDKTQLIRSDAIFCLFDLEKKEPIANNYQVAVRVVDFNKDTIFAQTIHDSYLGEVIDIMPETLSGKLAVGDRVILTCPYEMTLENMKDTFIKLSTNNGFYVVCDSSAVACKIND